MGSLYGSAGKEFRSTLKPGAIPTQESTPLDVGTKPEPGQMGPPTQMFSFDTQSFTVGPQAPGKPSTNLLTLLTVTGKVTFMTQHTGKLMRSFPGSRN